MKPYPELNQPFELTLDGDAPENQPLAMVANDGYDADGWKHSGKVVTGTKTRKFQIVSVGYCLNHAELQRRLTVYGPTPEGQWRNAFKAEHPESDGKGPVGVDDASWVSPGGGARFPCVYGDGSSFFYHVEGDFDGDLRFLVPAVAGLGNWDA